MTVDSVNAAMALTDAWEPALSRSWWLGYHTGRREGWHAGRDDEREAWNQIIGVYASITNHPTRAAIEQAQAQPITCRALCGRCSACTRIAAIKRNRARYGQDDFPGCAPRPGAAA